MTRCRLAWVAGLALAITASLATPGLAQKGDLSTQRARINALRSPGKYSEALPLAMYQKVVGTEHPAVATLLNNMGQLDRDLNRDADAEAPIKRSLAIREKVLGPDHPDVARSLNNLAGLYEHQQGYADAEPLYRRALVIRERALGPDHPDVATSTSNLAYFLYV